MTKVFKQGFHYIFEFRTLYFKIRTLRKWENRQTRREYSHISATSLSPLKLHMPDKTVKTNQQINATVKTKEWKIKERTDVKNRQKIDSGKQCYSRRASDRRSRSLLLRWCGTNWRSPGVWRLWRSHARLRYGSRWFTGIRQVERYRNLAIGIGPMDGCICPECNVS